MTTKNMSKTAFALRGEWIGEKVEADGNTKDVEFLLEDDFSRGLINAMCQLMADSGCRAGEKPASSVGMEFETEEELNKYMKGEIR